MIFLLAICTLLFCFFCSVLLVLFETRMTSRRLDSNTSRRMEFLLPRSVGPATCNGRWKKEGGSEFMAFPSSHSIYRPKDNNGSENNNDKNKFCCCCPVCCYSNVNIIYPRLGVLECIRFIAGGASDEPTGSSVRSGGILFSFSFLFVLFLFLSVRHRRTPRVAKEKRIPTTTPLFSGYFW